jgi:Rrf2 family iron-sulfur cluster assembly transcriptional regulator
MVRLMKLLYFSNRLVLVLAALAEIALQPDRPHAVKDLCRRLDVPRRYLEPYLQMLTRAELLTSLRGARGGYTLRRGLQTSAYEVAKALQDERHGPLLGRFVEPSTVRAIRPIEHALEESLKEVTLYDLVNLANRKLNA